jgi:hypothetical protein
VHKRIISAGKRVEFVSDTMSNTILTGCWCHIIVLNVHAPTEDKIDDVKDSWTLRGILERQDGGGVDWVGLAGQGQVESSCESGNEPSDSIKCWETIERLHNW